MFIDEVIVELLAGTGGDGCMAFRREKYIEMGFVRRYNNIWNRKLSDSRIQSSSNTILEHLAYINAEKS